MHSLFRRLAYRRLSQVTLHGKVLDIGGAPGAEYHRLFQGDATFTTINLNPKLHPDIVADAEESLPISDSSYDAILLINLIEHVWHVQELIRECRRVLKSGGRVIVIVPFLFPIHPQPQDYARYTDTALKRLFEETGFQEVKIGAIGSGVFAVRYQLLNRLLPVPIRILGDLLCLPFVLLFDKALSSLARLLGKTYSPSLYPLGYFVEAIK